MAAPHRPLLLSMLTCVHVTHACAQRPQQAADTVHFVPSEQHSIIVPVTLNGMDTLQLMFHSGFTGVSVTREGLKHCTSMHIDAEGIAHSWGGDAKSGLSRNNALRIGRHTWDSVAVTVDELSTQGSDGKFGWDLFAGRVLEIDRDHRALVIHPALPPIPTGAVSLPLEARDGSLYVAASVELGDSLRTTPFMLHTGFGGSCILGTDLMAQVPPGIALDTLGTQQLSDAYGNVLTNIATRIPKLILAGHTFHALDAQVMDPRSHFADSVLGSGLLSRFNAVLDLDAMRLFLRPAGAAGAGASTGSGTVR